MSAATRSRFLAVDLGASSGRVMDATVTRTALQLREVHRFANRPVDLPDGLHWDLTGLYLELSEGIRRAPRLDEVRSIGIDAWGCDYGLVGPAGELRGLPYHYRDDRTTAVIATVHDRVSPAELYARCGVQFLPFNTLYQLFADHAAGRDREAQRLLMVPDLLAYWLTGIQGGEVTNASTTGLLDVATRTWSDAVVAAAGLRAPLLPPLFEPGTEVGPLRPAVATELGCPPGLGVVRVGSHDTASAVVAVPGSGDDWAYIVCGTWSLVGTELERPVTSEASRLANFSNEAGVDGTVRYLRNVMGLWLLQEALHTWRLLGLPHVLEPLLTAAADAPGGPLIDPDDPRLLAPGDMPARIALLCRESGQREPSDQATLVRCILDSLAATYARTVDEMEQLTGRRVDRLHLVGGGARNTLLGQLTADASGRTVIAGPVEATSIGNVLVQARACGAASGDLDSLRSLSRRSEPLVHFEPRPGRRRR